ncbi:hypothetical protein SSBR45G_46240 [Bradyrhizobium sp. SSBR45G]|uniref:hypothetical protein n=1 Tax=unclassified Bradyrhizobium TaxID=2631580 RepID=UPI002342AEFC|nr:MULTISPECIES: hypothetical protein [unclassified Bradyrhizobium]GLH79715.1 hypothetical protein SSBR45G_46240 [Bradyrhizobium sp. SSBR45G]GLH87167.1 hypothetical protein SSBR45R_46270 [Bradyrhizobium sp. SSBR45R]
MDFMFEIAAAKAASEEALRGVPKDARWVPVEKDENGNFEPVERTYTFPGPLWAKIQAEEKFEGRDWRRLKRERSKAWRKAVRENAPDQVFTMTWE